MDTHVFHLLPSEIEILMIEAHGSGGYQSLIRKCQKAVNPATGQIELSENDVSRILKAQGYGQGTFQERIYSVFHRVLSE